MTLIRVLISPSRRSSINGSSAFGGLVRLGKGSVTKDQLMCGWLDASQS